MPFDSFSEYIWTYLHHGKVVVDEQGENGAGDEQELDSEGVVIVIVGGLELEVN